MNRIDLRRARIASAAALLVSSASRHRSGRNRRRIRRTPEQRARRSRVRGQRGRVDPGHLHHARHRGPQRQDQRPLPRSLQPARRQAKQFDGQPMSPASARAIALLRQGVQFPAPRSRLARGAHADSAPRLEAAYGQPSSAWRDNGIVTASMRSASASVRPATTTRLKSSGRAGTTRARSMRKDYERFVSSRTRARDELGYADMGAMWRSGYDMSPEEFTAGTEKLWNQVKPLYERCTATRVRSSRSSTARTRCRRASRSRRICSATCGASSGTRSTTTCCSPIRPSRWSRPTARSRNRSGTPSA